MLHQDDFGAVGSDDIFGVAEEEGEAGTKEHEDDEGDVGSVADVLVGSNMDVLAQGDLVVLE